MYTVCNMNIKIQIFEQPNGTYRGQLWEGDVLLCQTELFRSYWDCRDQLLASYQEWDSDITGFNDRIEHLERWAA